MTESFTLSELKAAIESGENNKAIIAFLKEQNLYDLIYPHGETVLHWSCAFNNAEVTEYILSSTPLHINISNFRGTTALYYATMSASNDVVKQLLKYHANPRIRSGFSDLFPIEVAEDADIKELLQKADDDYVAITGFRTRGQGQSNLRAKRMDETGIMHAYHYRVYMCFLSNLEYYIRMEKQGHSNGYETTIIPEVALVYEHRALLGVVETCNHMYEKYIALVADSNTDNKYKCLVCYNDTKCRCSKCKLAYFCDRNCQSKAHIFHRFDCI